LKSFRALKESILELKVESAVLDGEIVCLNDAGKPVSETCFSAVETRASSPSICSGTAGKI